MTKAIYPPDTEHPTDSSSNVNKVCGLHVHKGAQLYTHFYLLYLLTKKNKIKFKLGFLDFDFMNLGISGVSVCPRILLPLHLIVLCEQKWESGMLYSHYFYTLPEVWLASMLGPCSALHSPTQCFSFLQQRNILSSEKQNTFYELMRQAVKT